MASNGFAYSEKEMSGVTSMTVRNKVSSSSCDLGESFGFDDGKIWVHHGCRADFDVESCLGLLFQIYVKMFCWKYSGCKLKGLQD